RSVFFASGSNAYLCRLRPGVRLHCQRAAVLPGAWFLRPEPLPLMPRRPQGVDGLWRFNGWWWWLQRRWWRRFPRAQPARDVRSALLELRQDGDGAVPADQRQAGLLRRLLPAPPRLVSARATQLSHLARARPATVGPFSMPASRAGSARAR